MGADADLTSQYKKTTNDTKQAAQSRQFLKVWRQVLDNHEQSIIHEDWADILLTKPERQGGEDILSVDSAGGQPLLSAVKSRQLAWLKITCKRS